MRFLGSNTRWNARNVYVRYILQSLFHNDYTLLPWLDIYRLVMGQWDANLRDKVPALKKNTLGLQQKRTVSQQIGSNIITCCSTRRTIIDLYEAALLLPSTLSGEHSKGETRWEKKAVRRIKSRLTSKKIIRPKRKRNNRRQSYPPRNNSVWRWKKVTSELLHDLDLWPYRFFEFRVPFL